MKYFTYNYGKVFSKGIILYCDNNYFLRYFLFKNLSKLYFCFYFLKLKKIKNLFKLKKLFLKKKSPFILKSFAF
jgi:hypothetical protein